MLSTSRDSSQKPSKSLLNMDLFEELESMAVNITDDCDAELEPSEEEITRWQQLFAYSETEAIDQIKSQKSDYSRSRVSNDHWDLVRSQKEAQGFSRAAYEHWIKTGRPSESSHGDSNANEPVDISGSRAQSSYLILLEGPLNTPERIQQAASLPEPPQAIQAASETGDAVFCRINGTSKQSIEDWLSQQKSAFRPTFVRLSKANKDLSADSIHPTLGLESTLPQHRLSSDLRSNTDTLPHPKSSNRPVLQDEYPVWYFFYGTLADPVLLTRLLLVPEAEPCTLVPASISGGVIKTWQGKYKALVDGASTDHVHGSAFKVTSREREDALLIYETERYEVARCCISMASGTVQGLTFRFIGSL